MIFVSPRNDYFSTFVPWKVGFRLIKGKTKRIFGYIGCVPLFMVPGTTQQISSGAALVKLETRRAEKVF